MKTKLAILTVLCSASLWAWAQAVGGSSPAGNAPAGAAGKPPVDAPASPPNGAPGNAPNNGFNNNSGTMPPFSSGGSFQTITDANSKADGEIKKTGIVKPNTPFYNGGTTN